MEFKAMIEERSNTMYDLSAVCTWIEVYPNSFTVWLKTSWNGYLYTGELHINYNRPDFDAIIIKYDITLRMTSSR